MTLHCYDRSSYLKLPKINFYQLKIKYETLSVEEANPEKDIPQADDNTQLSADITRVTDFTMQTVTREIDVAERGTLQSTFPSWLYTISKESFGTLPVDQLMQYEELFQHVYS